jgi:hypothetical protein
VWLRLYGLGNDAGIENDHSNLNLSASPKKPSLQPQRPIHFGRKISTIFPYFNTKNGLSPMNSGANSY